MSNHRIAKNRFWLASWLGVLLVTCVALPRVFSSAPDDPPVNLRDTFTKESPKSVRVKEGFELIKSGPKTITVRRANNRRVIGKLECGECQAGCASNVSGRLGSCNGCTSGPIADCLIQ